jgi:hypothetical protein
MSNWKIGFAMVSCFSGRLKIKYRRREFRTPLAGTGKKLDFV